MAMMTLGLFVFQRTTAPFQQNQQARAWRHPSQGRVGERPSSQFVGVDEETMSLSGRLAPEITGGTPHLELIRTMADTGKAWPLIRGDGLLYGFFVIQSLEQTYAELFDNGTARIIDFTLSLKRVDDDRPEGLGDITDAILARL